MAILCCNVWSTIIDQSQKWLNQQWPNLRIHPKDSKVCGEIDAWTERTIFPDWSQFARVKQPLTFWILCLRLVFQLEPHLGLFELSDSAFLNVVLGEEESGADTSSTSSDAAENERPSEPIVGVTGHPFVAIAEACENYHTQSGTNARAKQKIRGNLKRWKGSFQSRRIKRIESHPYHKQEMLLIWPAA